MQDNQERYNQYFLHLLQISRLGRLYKKYFSSPILYWAARKFGTGLIEIGSGVGSGILGAYPKQVLGLDINPYAVDYCQQRGMQTRQIKVDGTYPVVSESFDCCILDNVLEHIEQPEQTLNECYRVTRSQGGMIIVVPGQSGYASDPDHKKYYDRTALENLDQRWTCTRIFSIPAGFVSEFLSRRLRSYCLVAVYKKNG